MAPLHQLAAVWRSWTLEATTNGWQYEERKANLFWTKIYIYIYNRSDVFESNTRSYVSSYSNKVSNQQHLHYILPSIIHMSTHKSHIPVRDESSHYFHLYYISPLKGGSTTDPNTAFPPTSTNHSPNKQILRTVHRENGSSETCPFVNYLSTAISLNGHS